MHGFLPSVVLVLLMAFATAPALAAKDRGQPWASLTAGQQQALAPLSASWDKMSKEQKVKWLGIARRYPAMKPEEQKRAQSRMQSWVKLTPEQRWQAREQYRSIGKLSADRRQELYRHWAEYQALPPHERRVFDVPPSYMPPAERRHRSAPSPKKQTSHHPYVLPAPL